MRGLVVVILITQSPGSLTEAGNAVVCSASKGPRVPLCPFVRRDKKGQLQVGRIDAPRFKSCSLHGHGPPSSLSPRREVPNSSWLSFSRARHNRATNARVYARAIRIPSQRMPHPKGLPGLPDTQEESIATLSLGFPGNETLPEPAG
jgi:hypothetical protein